MGLVIDNRHRQVPFSRSKVAILVVERTEMQGISTLSLGKTSDIGNNSLDFVPLMSASDTPNHEILDSNGPGSEDVARLKKRRQISLESGIALGVAIVEPMIGSSESSPTMMSTSTSATAQPDLSDECNDRTSKDYYFDSYSHHAIRTFFCLFEFLETSLVAN